MSVLEEIKALDAQRATLVQVAKHEFLEIAKNAVSELNKIGKDLGFRYVLKEEQTGTAATTSGKAPRKRLSADGIDEIMQVILAKIMSEPDGMTARQIFDEMQVPQASEQSYSGYIRKLVEQDKLKKIVTKKDGSNLAKKDIRYKAK